MNSGSKDPVRCVLSIAGSDPSGGAGVEADLKMFCLLGVYGTCVITSVTAQNTLGVQRTYHLPADLVGDQIESVVSDIKVDVIKTGMLGTRDILDVVCHKIREHNLVNLVVDPVLKAKDGSILLEEDAVKLLKSELLPLASVVTPNLEEAEALSGLKIHDVENMKKAARLIHELGCKWVLLKGGHLKKDAVDVLFDGAQFYEYRAQRTNGLNVHGTGCILSAAIAAEIAKGAGIPEGVAKAKDFVSSTIAHAVKLGRGLALARLFVPFPADKSSEKAGDYY